MNRKVVNFSIIVAYILVVLLFFGSVFFVPAYYNNLQNEYIIDAQEQLSRAFKTATASDELLLQELDRIVEQYPMELIVSRDNAAIYNTMIPVADVADLDETLDQRVILLYGSGSFTSGSDEYTVWYNVYQVQIEPFLFNVVVIQIILLGIATLILITIIVLMQRLMVQSVSNLKTTIGKLEQYQLDEVAESSPADALNSMVKNFAENLRQNISLHTQKEVSLEQQVFVNQEQFMQNQVVTAALVHDLKTPLYQTLLENQSLLESIDEHDGIARQITEYNIRRTDTVLQTINEILLLLRSNTYNSVPEAQEYDLTKVVSEVRKTFISLSREKDVLLHLETPESLVVTASKPLLLLLLHNIFSNAIEYSAAGQDVYVSLYTDETGKPVFECKNTASAANIARLQGDAELQAFSHVEHKYSGGNGVLLIKNLAATIGAEYQLIVEAEMVNTRIIFLDGEHDD